MNNKSLKRIYDFLEIELLEKFEHPCENCVSFDCGKNTLNTLNIIRKKYQLNVINWRHCLKREKESLADLMNILRLPEFRKWSFEKCAICKKKFFKHDMKIHCETEEKEHTYKISPRKSSKVYRMVSFRLCKKCNLSYVHRKKPLYKGFKKF